MATAVAPLPSEFLDLDKAFQTRDTQCNVIGVCVDYIPAVKSRGTDFTIKFTIHDPYWPGGHGMPCRFFNLDPAKLPSITNPGDTLIIRNLKVKDLKGELVGLSNPATSWVLLPSQSLSEDNLVLQAGINFQKSFSARYPLPAELAYAKWIWGREDQNLWSAPQKPTALQVEAIIVAADGKPPQRREKFSWIKDLPVPDTHGRPVFVDVLGEVRKVYSNDFRTDLYITDYTSHSRLYNYEHEGDEGEIDGDRFAYSRDRRQIWPGPWGKMTICVSLWDAQDAYARREIVAGQFVSLLNVKIELDKVGSAIEGKSRGDRMYPHKVNISTVSLGRNGGDERLKELLLRKREYEKKAKANNLRFIHNPATKRKAAAVEEKTADLEVTAEEDRPSKAKNRKKRDKRERQQEARQKTLEAIPIDRNRLNENVACNNHAEAKYISISEILDMSSLERTTHDQTDIQLPFHNCRYKAQVRVVDFFPKTLEDFCAPYREGDDMISDMEEDSDSDVDTLSPSEFDDNDVRWQWRFILLVEDARPLPPSDERPRYMELLVSDADGEGLLTKLDACNLRKNPQQLARLKEKLSILWGDLEELKQNAGDSAGNQILRPSNRPFACYIKEYGVRSGLPASDHGSERPYERMFRLYGTSIH